MQNEFVKKEEQRWSYLKKGKQVFNICTRLFFLGFIGMLAGGASGAAANPADGVVKAGSATISTSGSTTQINQSSNKALIEWGSFNIASGETTKFVQPGSNSVALNRVVNSSQLSSINGNLLANGKVFVINPNGVMLGAGAHVDTAGFIASTADMGNDAFMNSTGVYNFDKAGTANASVVNNGTITVKDAGLVALVAPSVANNGIIQGNLASINLGAGDTFGVDMYGDGLLHIALDSSTALSATNTGYLIADGGSVLMTAAAASDIVNSAINTSGIIQAHGLTADQSGNITLTGEGANVSVSGTVDASGVNGGTILVGGDQSGGGTLAKASTVTIAQNATLNANAGTDGNGGKIIVWADDTTTFAGNATAKGGSASGNGGFIETSTAKDIYFSGSVNASAANGEAGTFLLDPTTLNIKNGTGVTTSSNTIYEQTIEEQSQNGTNVLLTATNTVTMENLSDNILRGGKGNISLTATGANGKVIFNDKTDKIMTTAGNIVIKAGSGGVDIGTLSTTNGGDIIITTTNGGDVVTRNLMIDKTGGGPSTMAVTSDGALTINGDAIVTNLDISSNPKYSQSSAILTAQNDINVTGSLTVTARDIDQPYFHSKAHLGVVSTNGNITVGGPISIVSISQKTTNVAGENSPSEASANLTANNGSITVSNGISVEALAHYNGTQFDDTAIADLNVKAGKAIHISGSVRSKATANAGSRDKATASASFVSTGDEVYFTGGNPTVVASDSDYNSGVDAVAQQTYVGKNINKTVTSESGAALDTATLVVAGLHTVTVTAQGKTKVYGSADPTLTYSSAFTYPGSSAVPSNFFTGTLTRASGQNVGTYALSQGSLNHTTVGTDQYRIVFTGNNLTITPYQLVVNADAKSKVYGDADPSLTYTHAALVNGDTNSVFSGSLTRAAGQNVGTYAIGKGSLAAGSNYTIVYNGNNLTITPATLTVLANAKTKVYGDADPTLTYGLSGLKNGDTASVVTGSLTRATGQNVGTYAIGKGSLAAGSNYVLSYTGNNLTITPYMLQVIADAKSKQYGDADPALTYTHAALRNGDTASVFSGGLTRAPGENVGTYAIGKGSLAAGSNYTIVYTPANLVISPYLLKVFADAKTKVYGDADPALTYTYTGLKNGDTASVFSGNLTRTAGQNVGTYAIGQGTLTAANYSIVYTGANLTITPYMLNVLADAKSKVYGSADPSLTYTHAALVNGDTNSIFSGSLTRVAGQNVGTYAINKGSLSAGSNYTLNYTGANLSITPYALQVLADAKTKVYGSADPSLTYTHAALVNGDTNSVFSGSLTRAAGQNVGTYAIGKGSLAAGSNYTIVYTGNNLAITPYQLVVNADVTTKVYGSADPSLTYTHAALVNGDTNSVFSGSLTRIAGENVGSYAINKGSLSAGSNYTIVYNGNNLAITPYTLQVLADAKTKIYGDADPALTYTHAALVNGDTNSVFSGSLTRAAGENVGAYAIGQGSVSAGSNYTIVYTGNNLAITPATLTVLANAKTKVYGDGDPTLTYGLSGLKNGDTASVVTGSLTRAAGENVGSYAIGQGSLSAGNYILTYTGSNLVITPATLQVLADAKNKVYGSADTSLTYGFSGLKNGDTASVFSGSLTRAAGENVGTYAIGQGSLDAGQNYTIAYTSNNLNITPYQLIVTADNKAKVQGSLDPALTYTHGVLVNGDTSSVFSGGLTRVPGELVGNYAILQGSVAAGSNYTIVYQPGTLGITARPAAPNLLAPSFEVDALGRPIISYANQVIVLDAPFEPIETLTMNTDVSVSAAPGANTLANIEPAAGDDDDKKKKKSSSVAGNAEDLAGIEPAAGGNAGAAAAPAAGGDIACANAFLDNRPCNQ